MDGSILYAPAMSAGRAQKAVLNITKSAAGRIKELMSHRTEPCLGVKVGVRRRGCNGLSYTMDYALPDKQNKFDEVVEQHGVTVVVDSMAVIHLLGTEMDFVSDRIRSEFVFSNPNAKGECGCGESFNT